MDKEIIGIIMVATRKTKYKKGKEFVGNETWVRMGDSKGGGGWLSILNLCMTMYTNDNMFLNIKKLKLKRQRITNTGEDVGKLEFSGVAGAIRKWYRHLGSCSSFSKG